MDGSTFVRSKAKGDCVIVALANYYRFTYEKVESDLAQIKTEEESPDFGYFESTYVPLIAVYEDRQIYRKVPRRGQEYLTGIIKVSRANNKDSHLCFAINGKVYDNFTKGVDIKKYRETFGFHVKAVFTPIA